MNPSSRTVSSEEMVALTSRITAAYLRGNALPVADIAGVIAIVHGSLLQLGQPAPQQQGEILKPAVPIRRSVTAEYIVCLEDGRKLKMLKRSSARDLWHDAGPVPGQVEPAGGLPDGGAGLCREAQRACQGERPGQAPPRARAGSRPEKARPSKSDGLTLRALAPRTGDDRSVAVVSGAGR